MEILLFFDLILYSNFKFGIIWKMLFSKIFKFQESTVIYYCPIRARHSICQNNEPQNSYRL